MKWCLKYTGRNVENPKCLRFFVAIFCILFFVNCNTEKPEEKLQFYYYPGKNVYYDPARKVFFYSLNGAKTWNTFLVNNTNSAALGEKVIVYSNTTDVYRDNEDHRKIYNGNLINIDVNSPVSKPTQAEVAERIVTEKRTFASKEELESKKRKKGLGKIISKIFDKIRHIK